MTFYIAIMLGVLGSGHCVAMCGGLMTAINMQQQGMMRSVEKNMQHNLLLNLGRISSYILLGVAVAAAAISFQHYIRLPYWGEVMRLLLVIAMLIIGIQLIWQRSPLAFFEKIAKKFWTKLNIPFHILLPARTLRASYLLGLLWGLVPCGLVYSLLLLAMASHNLQQSALIMLAFGLGSLPAMFITGMAAIKVSQYMHLFKLREAAGVLSISVALWTLMLPYIMSYTGLTVHPALQNILICQH